VDALLLCHALSGCDTSCFFGFGKLRLFRFKLLEKLYDLSSEFYVRQEGQDRIINAGLKLIAACIQKM
jgi:hypothetical protein